MVDVDLRKMTTVGLAVLFATILAFVVNIGPASRYEVFLIGAYPLPLQVAFAIIICTGILLLITSGKIDLAQWLPAFVLIVSAYCVFYSLPLFRGYVIYGSPLTDALYHLSIVSDIITTGQIPNPLYPATHVLFTELSVIIGMPPRIFQMPVSFIFTLLLIIGCFVSARRFMSKRGGIYVLAAAISLPYSSLQLSVLPWFYALALIPLVLLALQIRNSPAAKIIILILVYSIVRYHPLTGLLLMGIVVIYTIWSAWFSHRSPQGRLFVAFVGIVAAVWALRSNRVQLLIQRTVLSTTAGAGVATYASRAAESTYTLKQLLVEFIILRWGPPILFMITALAVVLYVTVRSLRRHRLDIGGMFSVQYIVGLIFGVSLAVLQVLSQNPVRISQFALFFSIYLVGYGLWRAFQKNQYSWRTVRSTLGSGLVAIILVTAVLSTGIAYGGNAHMTHSTVAGTDWHLQYHTPTYQTKSFRMSRNIQLYLQGFENGTQSPLAFSRFRPEYQLPQQLGYDTNETIETTLRGTSYLVTKNSDVAWYRSRSKGDNPTNYYTKANVQRLARDNTASKIYSNGAFKVWLSQS